MQAIETVRTGQAADLLLALVRTDGSASHPYLRAPELTAGREALRNLADAAHYLCVLYGRFPGVVDHARGRARSAEATAWLERAADAFAAERAFLTRLAVATGPLPSTPGQADCEAAVLQQRHALEMLAQSDRHGCAFGAAAALVLDWQAIRGVLDAAARRVSLERQPCLLPEAGAIEAAVLAEAGSTGVERAMTFGAQQLLAQHRGLWTLLEAREGARARA